jgi:outer membrane protein TolC
MKKYSIILVICFLGFTPLIAQNSSQELQSLILESFNYFPKIKELEQSELISNERLKNTRGNLLPAISGVVSYNYIDPISQTSFPAGPGITKNLQFQPNNNLNANITANYAFLDFGRLKTAIDKSKEELNFSKQNTLYNMSQLASQVANIYYNIIYLKKAIVIQDSIIHYFEQNKDVIQSKLSNGDALKIDVLNIQASIDNELNRKVDLENSLQKQLNLLEYTTGKRVVNQSEFSFAIKNVSAEEYINLAESQNVEYALIKSKIAQSEFDLKLNKKQLTPTLNATAAAGFRNGYQPDINENRFNYLAGVRLNVPIFSGLKARSQIGVATYNLRQTELGLVSLKNIYKKDIKQSLSEIDANQTKLRNIES